MSEMASVTDIRAARGRGDPLVRLAREPLTVICQVSNVRADAEVHRQIGLNDALSFHDLHDVLTVCFDLPDEDSPWHFFEHHDARGKRIDPTHQVSEFLWRVGSQVDYTWGLWDFSLVVADIYPRDAGSPRALCVGGSGSFPGSSFNLTAVNAALTGQDTIDEVLELVTEEVRQIVERTRLYDFVPLLQALDLEREGDISPQTKRVRASLPREVTSQGKDAFWSTVLGLACLSGPEVTDSVIETTMNALGWVDDDGSELAADQARHVCEASLRALAEIGGLGEKKASPVERLDIYRALLRR